MRRPLLPPPAAPVRRLALAAVLAAPLAMAGLPAPPGLAQSFLGAGPAERLTLPPTGDALCTGPQRPPAPPQPPAAAPEAPAAPAVQMTIAPARRLPAGPRGFRLSGEEDRLQFPVYLTEAQARGPARLRISYLSAISVAPEFSELTGLVNGTKVGWTRIQAPGAVKVVEFTVPDGVLRAGYNAVTLTASQRHRVDCSTDATYELWTQIDSSRSGLVVPPATDLDVRSLAALEPDESGALPIGVLLGEKPSLERLGRMIGAVQAVALVGRLARPAVSFGPPLTGRSGINLLVGTAGEIRGQEGVEALGAITGPRLALLPARANRAPVLVVTGRGEDEVRQAIALLATTRDGEGTQAGVALVPLTRGYEVQGGESLSLSQLGLSTREFSGHLLRIVFEVRFPPDFVPADYGKVMLHLAGAYQAGLDPDARVVVDVNGRNAASVPLPSGRGEIFDDNAIPLPLSLWRPGLNRVEISAQLPIAADRACDTLSPAAKQARFLFLDRTRLDIPALARAMRSPDLGAFRAGALPFSAPGQTPRLALPTPDRDSSDAAATLAARLAIAAGRVIDFEVVGDATAPGKGPRLVVAPARALSPAVVEAVGLDPGEIRRIWEARAETVAMPAQFGGEGVLTLDRLRRNLPMRCALPPVASPVRTAAATAGAGPALPRPAQTAAAAASEDEIVARWDESLRGSSSIADILASARDDLASWATAAADVFGERVLDRARDPAADPARLNPRASLIVAEGAAGTLAETTVLVTAPNASMLKASVSCLVDPVVWTRLGGRAALLDASDGSLGLLQPEHVALVETRERGLSNARLVIAAWLSLNPAYYVAMTLVMAVCLGLATTNLVRHLGRRNT